MAPKSRPKRGAFMFTPAMVNLIAEQRTQKRKQLVYLILCAAEKARRNREPAFIFSSIWGGVHVGLEQPSAFVCIKRLCDQGHLMLESTGGLRGGSMKANTYSLARRLGRDWRGGISSRRVRDRFGLRDLAWISSRRETRRRLREAKARLADLRADYELAKERIIREAEQRRRQIAAKRGRQRRAGRRRR